MQSSRIFRKLFKNFDPLHELPDAKEKQTIYELHKIRNKLNFLKAILQSGAPVEQELEKTKAQYFKLRSILPRGHDSMFLVLCSCCSVFLLLLATFYINAENAFVELWGSPDNDYLQRYRPIASLAWSWIKRLTPAMCFGILPAVALGFLGYVQNRLPRWHARRVIYVSIVFLFVAVSFVGCCLLSLTMLPLG